MGNTMQQMTAFSKANTKEGAPFSGKVHEKINMNNNEKLYYDMIVSTNKKNSFINNFNLKWQEYLNSFNLPYGNSQQLVIGNRLRPILCCWGYMHNYEVMEIDSFDYISSVAVSLEAVHRASVIIDDVIDGDNKRKGGDCFRVEFSEREANFFAVCLLSGAIKNINEILSKAVSNQIIMMLYHNT